MTGRLELARPSPRGDARSRTEVAAVLRWRARWLSRSLPAPLAAAARLFPVLLHASFDHPGLRELAPGVAGLRYRPSWGSLARCFDLPPPHRAQRGTCVVEAVLARKTGERRLELTVLVPEGLRADEYGELEDRMEAARLVLAADGASVATRLLDIGRLAHSHEVCHELAAFGALLAGRVPAPAWAALEEAASEELGGDSLFAMMTSAPTAFAAVTLAVMSAGSAPAPFAALSELAHRERARHLADPSFFTCRWAARAGRSGELLEQVLRLAEPALASRALPPAPEQPGPAPVLATGRSLAVACARAARCAPLHARARRDAWRAAFVSEFPRILLPALRARLDETAGGPLSLRPERRGAFHEVLLPDGTLLARGATASQARVRALSLAAAALGERRVAGALDRAWLPLAARLAAPGDAPALLLVLEGAGLGSAPASGGPLDPLNRGPERLVGFLSALALRTGRGKRATVREVESGQAVRLLLAAASAGVAVEVVAARAEVRPAAARLAGMVALLSDPALARPLAAEVGGEVLVPVAGRVMRYGLRRYLTRPRFVTPDPEAPDLSLTLGDRSGHRWRAAGVIEARASLLDPARAAVIYADAAGRHLREEVALAELEEHLRDARLALLAADGRAVLAMRLSDDLEPLLRRLRPPPPPVEVGVAGEAPFGLALTVAGERFEGIHRWEDAAQAAMSTWPMDLTGRLAVRAVTATVAGEPVTGLVALYVRSLALRRLRARVSRAFRSYRDSLARRREG